MHRLSRLLVVVEPSETAPATLARAILLARHFLARIDLLLCARRDAVEAGERFLQGLVAAVAARDVAIDPCARAGPSIAEIVAARLREAPADLVIKHPDGRAAPRRRMWSSNDWQLLQACPCNVLLTRGRPWRAVPRFAAAIDVPEGLRSARAVLEALIYLSLTLDARTEVLHVATSGEAPAPAWQALRRVATELHLPAETWSLLEGEPAVALADAATGKALDLILLGAHARGPDWRALLGASGSRPARQLDCDLLLVNAGA